MKRPFLHKVWGEATAVFDRSRRFGWVDLLVVIGLAGLLHGLIDLAREWTGESRPSIAINLSVWALPHYTFFSLARGLLAYVISLCFTLLYGYWAAKDRMAERVLLPLLDILQSIPVLGFMPGLILALVALFPPSITGLELAAVIMIFTGQAWNMTFSFYHSLRSVPLDMREAATVYRFSWWQRFKWVELPYSTMGLVWNSMMSMAGGWFFLMINEAFRLGDKDFRLPGIGSYMSVAVEQGRIDAMLFAIVAMIVMIIFLDQLLWRPVVVWAQNFRVEEGGHQEAMTSWFLDWLRRSHLLALVGEVIHRIKHVKNKPTATSIIKPASNRRAISASKLPLLLLVLLLAVLAYGAWKLFQLLQHVTFVEWSALVMTALLTLGRVLLATAVGTLWALPAGLAIGLSPRLSRVLQPVVDPEILFMDEPFSQVDALTAESLRAEVLDIWSAKKRNPASILMVSHDIKEVAFMADRIVILSANPGRVRTVVQNDLPRPRDYRSSQLLSLVDHLHEIITGTELPDVPVVAVRRDGVVEPLPEVSTSKIVGLLEYLDARDGRQDVFRIASDTNREFGQMINVVKAAEMLNFVDTPRSLVVLEPDGKRFVQASPEQRKAIWREQLLKLRLFREIYEVLQRQLKHEVDRDFVLETIIMHLPQENYEKVFNTLIRWARYGDLFSYDETTGEISLE